MPRPRNPSLYIACPQCGATFKTSKSRIAQARLTGLSFCSNKCAGLYKAQRGMNKPPLKAAKPENSTATNCRMCNAPIVVANFHLRQRQTYGPFCSHACYGKWRSENLAGANSPEWNGGRGGFYGNRDWQRRRREIVERDNATCQDCGAVGGRLDVHHIKSIDLFTDREQANELTNLITLCRKCHSRRHEKELSHGNA